jgi:hypothetical protein
VRRARVSMRSRRPEPSATPAPLPRTPSTRMLAHTAVENYDRKAALAELRQLAGPQRWQLVLDTALARTRLWLHPRALREAAEAGEDAVEPEASPPQKSPRQLADEVVARKKASGFDDRPRPTPTAPADGLDRPDRPGLGDGPFDPVRRTQRRRQAPDAAAEVLTAAGRVWASRAVDELRARFPLPPELRPR